MKVLIIFSVLVAFTAALPQCAQNQEYKECGTACPATCKSIQSKDPMMCTMQCKSGCFCKGDLVLNDIGLCVDRKTCPVSTTPASHQCPKPNQKYNECGTACEATCKNPEPGVCTQQCVKGCFCEPGFLKDAEGNCVRKESCPAVKNCPKANQIWSDCGSSCPESCKSIQSKDKIMCTQQCVAKCVCTGTLVLDDNGNCIDRKKCPVSTTPNQCPKPHQKYNECGTACEPSCKTPKPEMCTEQCVKGCFCDPGFLKDAEGNCVPQESCPVDKSCPKANQIWSDCGSACAPTCRSTNANTPALACTAQCIKGCVCVKGYLKNDQDECVLKKDCKKCEKNEKWTDQCVAPRWCQGPYCPNNPNQRMCKAACQPGGGCICKDGFYRNDQSNCVRLNQCNKGTTPKPGTTPKAPVLPASG